MTPRRAHYNGGGNLAASTRHPIIARDEFYDLVRAWNFRLDLYAGTIFEGELRVENAKGDGLVKEDFDDTAPWARWWSSSFSLSSSAYDLKFYQ